MLDFVFVNGEPDPVADLVAQNVLPPECATFIHDISKQIQPTKICEFRSEHHCVGTFLEGCRPGNIKPLTGRIASVKIGSAKTFYLTTNFLDRQHTFPYASNLMLFHQAREFKNKKTKSENAEEKKKKQDRLYELERKFLENVEFPHDSFRAQLQSLYGQALYSPVDDEGDLCPTLRCMLILIRWVSVHIQEINPEDKLVEFQGFSTARQIQPDEEGGNGCWGPFPAESVVDAMPNHCEKEFLRLHIKNCRLMNLDTKGQVPVSDVIKKDKMERAECLFREYGIAGRHVLESNHTFEMLTNVLHLLEICEIYFPETNVEIVKEKIQAHAAVGRWFSLPYHEINSATAALCDMAKHSKFSKKDLCEDYAHPGVSFGYFGSTGCRIVAACVLDAVDSTKVFKDEYRYIYDFIWDITDKPEFCVVCGKQATALKLCKRKLDVKTEEGDFAAALQKHSFCSECQGEHSDDLCPFHENCLAYTESEQVLRARFADLRKTLSAGFHDGPVPIISTETQALASQSTEAPSSDHDFHIVTEAPKKQSRPRKQKQNEVKRFPGKTERVKLTKFELNQLIYSGVKKKPRLSRI